MATVLCLLVDTTFTNEGQMAAQSNTGRIRKNVTADTITDHTKPLPQASKATRENAPGTHGKAKPKRKPRSVMPNKDRIRNLRKRHALTQQDLADKIGCDKRNIQRAERDGCRVSLCTLDEIAQALEVETHELIVPDFLTGDDPEAWLERAIRYDLDANYGLAIQIAEAILAYASPPDSVFQKACIRLASFHEHCHNWERALDLLQAHVPTTAEALDASRDGQAAWGLYQRGLIRRCYAEDLLQHTAGARTPRITHLLSGAREDLQHVCESPAASKSAPLHQLGVLAMLDGDNDQALALFHRSLRLRQERDGEDPLDHGALFRQGYTYRRMGQCYARMGQMTDAHECLCRALDIAHVTQHRRLALETRRDLTAWGLTETSGEQTQRC